MVSDKRPRVHQGLVGRPAQRLSRRLDARQHPEGLRGGNGQGAVWTWVEEREEGLTLLSLQTQSFSPVRSQYPRPGLPQLPRQYGTSQASPFHDSSHSQ
ncbi:hypothetical protein EYF80_059921 [Liparis tanakae]|uniref:Uncharacterized protein n=1 Tax=Liparis tanakae TaxID=230148 RepID=A0A4Z2EME9_9TELE|nr:hypothetical protein EYF80_059921 [Liparis tanakae]